MVHDDWAPPAHNKISPAECWRGFATARFPVWPATRQLVAELAERMPAVGWGPERISACLAVEGHVVPADTIMVVLRDLGRQQ